MTCGNGVIRRTRECIDTDSMDGLNTNHCEDLWGQSHESEVACTIEPCAGSGKWEQYIRFTGKTHIPTILFIASIKRVQTSPTYLHYWKIIRPKFFNLHICLANLYMVE